MASTIYTYALTGSTKFPVNFEYLARRFVRVSLVGKTRRVLTLNVDYRFTSKSEIETTIAWSPGSGFETIEIRRITSATDRLVNFTDGSILRSQDLNIAQIQAIHIAEEGRDISDTSMQNSLSQWDALGYPIRNLGYPSRPTDSASVQYVTDQMARTLRVPEGTTVNQLPEASSRANRLLSFDAAGNPIAVAPTSGSSAELAADLMNPLKGDSNIMFLAAGEGAVPRPTRSKLRDVVSVLDYYDPQEVDATVKAFRRAFAAGRGVEVPKGANLTGMNDAVIIPDKKDISIEGYITGTTSGRFEMAGSGEFLMSGGMLTNVYLKLLGGSPRVLGYRYTGRAHTAGILIQGTTGFKGMIIDRPDISGANYGILRQGEGSSMSGAHVTNGVFHDLKGDAIEWNICVDDKNINFISHVIDLIDAGPAGNINWGIGIGVAGSSYDNSYPNSRTVKDFTIAQIKGSRMRQLVHVENGNRFDIANITGFDISDAYSQGAGIAKGTVVVYGSTNFTIDTVNDVAGPSGSGVGGGVYVGYGTSGGNFIAAPQNYSLTNVRVTGGNVVLETGNTKSTVDVTNVNIDGGQFSVLERPGKFSMRNVKATRNRAAGVAMRLRFDLNIDGKQAFRAGRPCSLEIVDCEGLDEFMATSVEVTGVVQDKVTLKGNNFDIDARAGGSTPITRDVNRVLSGRSNGLPYGHEFTRTDMFIDLDTGTKYIFTGAGSLTRASDSFIVEGTTGKLIRSSGLSWTTGFHHEVGQRITLSGAWTGGLPLSTTVVRCYLNAGRFLIEVSDTIVAPEGSTGVITSTQVATYLTI